MTPRTPQCEVFCPFLSSSEHSGVPEDSQPPTFPSVGLHPHTWPKWGCDTMPLICSFAILLSKLYVVCVCMICKQCVELEVWIRSTSAQNGFELNGSW